MGKEELKGGSQMFYFNFPCDLFGCREKVGIGKKIFFIYGEFSLLGKPMERTMCFFSFFFFPSTVFPVTKQRVNM